MPGATLQGVAALKAPPSNVDRAQGDEAASPTCSSKERPWSEASAEGGPGRADPKRSCSKSSQGLQRRAWRLKTPDMPPLFPPMPAAADGRCFVAGCSRPCAEGYRACCRTCQRTGGRKHGPSCEASSVWRECEQPPLTGKVTSDLTGEASGACGEAGREARAPRDLTATVNGLGRVCCNEGCDRWAESGRLICCKACGPSRGASHTKRCQMPLRDVINATWHARRSHTVAAGVLADERQARASEPDKPLAAESHADRTSSDYFVEFELDRNPSQALTPVEDEVEPPPLPLEAAIEPAAVDAAGETLIDMSKVHTGGDAIAGSFPHSRASPRSASSFVSDCSLADLEEMLLIAKQHQMETACTRPADVDDGFEYLDVWGTPISDLGEYGPGVMLYFEWLKWMGIFFTIMLLASMPMIAISFMGDFVNAVLDQDGGTFPGFQVYLARLTLGNIGACGESHHCMDSTSRSLRALTPGSTTRLRDVTVWLGLNDVVVLLIFFIGVQWFYHSHTPRIVEFLDVKNVTASDFAIKVEGLPERVGDKDDPAEHRLYEAKLREHFESLLIDELGVAGPDSAPVKEIVLVRQFEGALQTYQAQGELFLQVENRKKHIAELNWKLNQSTGLPQEAQKLKKRMAGLTTLQRRARRQLEACEARLASSKGTCAEDRDVCSAFVVFDKEQYKDHVIRTYANFGARFTHPACLFEGKNLHVKQAPEPMDVMWENMDVRKTITTRRRYMTCCFSIVVVWLCAFGVLTLRSVPVDVKLLPVPDRVWTLYNSSHCWGLNDVRFFADPLCEQELTDFGCLDANGSQVRDAATCRQFRAASCEGEGGAAYGVGVVFDPPAAVNCVRVSLSASQAEAIQLESCQDFEPRHLAEATWHERSTCNKYRPVVLPEDDATSGTGGQELEIVRKTELQLSCSRYPEMTVDEAQEAKRHISKSYSAAEIAFHPRLGCYCGAQAAQRGQAWVWFGAGGEDGQMARDVCQEFLSTYRERIIRGSAGGLVVVFFNQILLFMFYHIDTKNVHKSRTGLASGQLVNLWFSQTLVTGLMVILSSQNFPNTLDKLGFRPRGHYYDNFDSSWFMMVGSTYCMVLAAQAVSAAGFGVVWILTVDRFVRWYSSRNVFLQELLNEAFEFPEWTVASRFAESLTIVFCVLMFSGLMPLLYAIGALYCFAAYWLDKWSLLRGSCKPPGYDESMFRTATSICLAAVLAHLLVTIWAFGFQELFPSDWGPLKEVFQSLLGYQTSRYQEVMALFDSHGDARSEYVQARLLDFGRLGCLAPVSLAIPFGLYCVWNLAWLALRPVTKNIRGYLARAQRRAENQLWRATTATLSSAGIISSKRRYRRRSTATVETYSQVVFTRRQKLEREEAARGAIPPELDPGFQGTSVPIRRRSTQSSMLLSVVDALDMPTTEKGHCMSYDLKWHPKYEKAYMALFYARADRDR